MPCGDIIGSVTSRLTTSNCTWWMWIGWASIGEVVDLPDLGRADGWVLGDRRPSTSSGMRPRRRRRPRCRAAPPRAERLAVLGRSDARWPCRRPSTTLTRRRTQLVEADIADRDRRCAERLDARGQARARRGGAGVGSSAAARTRNCMTWPVVSGSAGAKSAPGSPPPNGSSGPTLLQDDARCPRGTSVKSTMTSARSAGRISSCCELHRRGQEAALGCRSARTACRCSSCRIRKRALAAVEEAEAVAALLDLQVRPGLAVDDHRVAEELGVPDAARCRSARRPAPCRVSGIAARAPGNCWLPGSFRPSKKARLSG